jgi:LPXTG-motif cell wall-anchored protein
MTKGASGGGSKAWIAGAVVGPIVGLALVGALFWFLLRRRKNRGTTPQQGSATMTSVDPSQPPAGANQSALAAQQGYASLPLSPAPHYNGGATPYNAPGSPPPQQAYFGNDGKIEYTGAVLGGASELVGEAGGATSPSAHATTNGYTAELGGQLRQSEGPGLFGPSELPTNSSNPMPTR